MSRVWDGKTKTHDKKNNNTISKQQSKPPLVELSTEPELKPRFIIRDRLANVECGETHETYVLTEGRTGRPGSLCHTRSSLREFSQQCLAFLSLEPSPALPVGSLPRVSQRVWSPRGTHLAALLAKIWFALPSAVGGGLIFWNRFDDNPNFILLWPQRRLLHVHTPQPCPPRSSFLRPPLPWRSSLA